MKLDGIELYGTELSHHILRKISKLEQEMIYDRTKKFIKIDIHIVDFCSPMHLNFGKRELPEPENYKSFLECEEFTKGNLLHLPIELAMKLSSEQLKLYCYLMGIAHYFDFYELDWLKVCDNYMGNWRDFFSMVKELQGITLSHAYFDYPVLITELSNTQLSIIIDAKDKEEAYELLQKYRRIVA
jgi:hypothetical protein